MSFGNQDQGGGFQYQRPSATAIQERQQQRGGGYETFIRSGIPEWAVSEGEHRIRILPATWKNAEHFGYQVHVHGSVGPDRAQILSRFKMLGPGEEDPIVVERERATRAGDNDYADSLKASARCLYWIIDRDKEREGPQLWNAAWTFDRDLNLLCVDKRTREILYIDHPVEGYDLYFTRQGKGLKTKYIGLQLDRRPSPISDDPATFNKWLQFIQDNPIPSLLVYPPVDHIKKLLAAGPAQDSEKQGGGPQTRTEQTGGRYKVEEVANETSRRVTVEEAPRGDRTRQFDDEDTRPGPANNPAPASQPQPVSRQTLD